MERFNPTILIILGVIFSIIGVLIISIGAILESPGNISTGGVIFIGPIPIVFGSGEYGSQLIWLGLVIAGLMLIVYYIMIRQRKQLEHIS